MNIFPFHAVALRLLELHLRQAATAASASAVERPRAVFAATGKATVSPRRLAGNRRRLEADGSLLAKSPIAGANASQAGFRSRRMTYRAIVTRGRATGFASANGPSNVAFLRPREGSGMANRKRMKHCHEPGRLHEFTFSCHRWKTSLTNDMIYGRHHDGSYRSCRRFTAFRAPSL